MTSALTQSAFFLFRMSPVVSLTAFPAFSDEFSSTSHAHLGLCALTGLGVIGWPHSAATLESHRRHFLAEDLP